MALKARPIVEKLVLASMLKVEEAPENVRLVVLMICTPPPEILRTEVPSVIERMLLLSLANWNKLHVRLLVLKEPAFTITMLAVRGSCSVHPPPIPSKVISPMVFPAVVTVLPAVVASNLVFSEVRVIPAVRVSEPYMFRVWPAPSKAGELDAPVQVMSLQAAVPMSSVTVCPGAVNEFTSKKTLSVDCGTWVLKVLPPEEVAQCVANS